MELTPQLESAIIKILNEKYKEINKDVSISELDKDLKKVPWDKFFEKFNANKEFVSKFSALKETVGEEQANTFLTSFISLVDPNRYYGSLPSKELEFASFLAPKELEETLYVWDWELKDFKINLDLEDILKKLSTKQKEDLLKKLPFKAVYKDGKLVAIYPTKNKKFIFYFDLPGFLTKAQKSIEKQSKVSSIDKEQLIENLASVLIEKLEAEDQYYSSEEYALNSDYGQYAAEGVEDKELEELLENLDENISSYVTILLEKDVSEEEIIQLLLDSSSEEYNDSYRRVDNSIGSFSLSDEEQLSADHYEDLAEFQDTSKFPYPDLSSNLSLLDEEDLEALKKQVERNTSASISFGYNDKTGEVFLRDPSLYLSDSRSIELVVDSRLFISAAKRYLKDLKVMKKYKLGATISKRD